MKPIFYYSQTCSLCKITFMFLNVLGVEFQGVELKPEGEDWRSETGEKIFSDQISMVPAIVDDGNVYTGQRVREYLNKHGLLEYMEKCAA